MKHVLLLTTAQVSAVTFYRGYVRYLVDHGWRVSIASASDGGLERWARSEGARGYRIPFARDIDLRADLRALGSCWRLIRQIKPDVVVGATPKAALLAMVASWLARVPVRIYELWGLRLETERGLKRRILTVLEQVAMACATQVFANSPSLARVATELGLPGRKAIRVLGQGSSHGVDTQHFSRERTGDVPPPVQRFLDHSGDGLVVGFIGRMTVDKGVDTLLAAMDRCNERSHKVRLILVGPTEDEALAGRIEDAVSRGFAYRAPEVSDVRGYLKAMDVLCLPTLREGFPNVVLEAAAMEVPAIVSDATGAVDSVVDGRTGWVFRTGDVTGLADLLKWAASHRTILPKIGWQARQRAIHGFDQIQIWEYKRAALSSGMARTYSH